MQCASDDTGVVSKYTLLISTLLQTVKIQIRRDE